MTRRWLGYRLLLYTKRERDQIERGRVLHFTTLSSQSDCKC